MWRLAWRSVRYQWRRFALTTLAVVLGVSSVTAAFVLSDSLSRAINQIISEAAAPVDMAVRPVEEAGGFGAPSRGLPRTVVAEVRSVPGVRAAHGSIQGAGQFVSPSGEVTREDFAGAGAIPDQPSLFGLDVRGDVPRRPGEAVVDARSAEVRNLEIGDTFQFATQNGVLVEKVVGVVSFGSDQGLGALAYVGLSDEEAAAEVGTPGRVDDVSVALEPGANPEEVASRIETISSEDDLEVLTRDELLDEASDLVGSAVTILTGVLLGFAAVTLFVSTFLIFNTFTIVVAQRSRELALLRAVGASTRQVTSAVITEALLVGAVASVVGLALGVCAAVGLRSLLSSIASQLPDAGLVVAPRTMLVAGVVGVGVTLLAVLAPARRAARVAPVAAMSAAVARETPARRFTVFVAAVTAVAASMVAAALTVATGPARLAMLAAGASGVFLGLTGLARHVAGPVVRFMAAIPSKFSLTYALAARNAERSPRRTASTAAALMIGLALVTSALIVGESFKAAFGGSLEASLSADVVIEPGGIVGVTPELVDELEALPGVDTVVALSQAVATIAPDETVTVTAVDTAALPAVFDVGLNDGTLPSGGGEVAVNADWAAERGVAVGDRLPLEGRDEWTVTGIYSADDEVTEVLATPETVRSLPGATDPAMLALVALDAAAASVPAAIIETLEASPGLEAYTTSEYIEVFAKRFDVVLGVVNVLLLLSVVVAALGITNTIALSVLERTRELGVLRAIGMKRRTLRRMVRTEGVFVAAFGGALGVGLGLVFGTAAVSALPADVGDLTYPPGRIFAVFVVAAVLGLIASALPARRAARLNVLDAIAEL